MDEIGSAVSATKHKLNEDEATSSQDDEASRAKRANFIGLTPLKNLNHISSPSDRPFRVSIEGNIGAGKSTLIEYFSGMAGIEVYPEPLAWWRNLQGNNLLELLYSDIDRWCHVFQAYVQLTRLKVQTSKPGSNTRVQMFERSLQNNRYCFLEQAHVNGYMHDANYAILDQWYRWIRENVDIRLDLIVYLRSSPEVVFKRTMQRGRPEETGVSLEYLTQLHESHEKWLMSNDERFNTVPVLVLDADKTLAEIVEMFKKNENQILGSNYKKRTVDKADIEKVKRKINL